MLYVIFTERTTASLQLQKTWLGELQQLHWTYRLAQYSIQSILFQSFPLFLLSASIPTAWATTIFFSLSVGWFLNSTLPRHSRDRTKLRRLETDERAGTHTRIGQFTADFTARKQRLRPYFTLTLPPQYCIFPPRSHKGILLPKTQKDQGKHSKQKRLRTHLQSQKPNWVRVRNRARMRASFLPAH